MLSLMNFVYTGEIAALATAVCWTVTSLAFEQAGKRLGSMVLNLVRLFLASVLLTGYCWLTRGLAWPTDASEHTWIWLSLSGVIGFTLGDLCLFRALVIMGARLSMLMMSLVPLLTALSGWLILGEGLSLLEGSGMLLTIAGVAWVVSERRQDASGKSGQPPLTGILLGLGGAVGQALGLVLSKYGMGDYNAFAATQIRVFAGLGSFALLFVFINWWGRVWLALKNPAGMGLAALGSFFGPFLGVSLSLLAVQYTNAGVAATLMALVPVFILVPAKYVTKERISLRAVAGAGLAVFGSALLISC
jgi:drug/metabolite transporter (DMT)-like permease